MTSSRDTTSDSSRRGQDGYADPMRLWADFQKWISSLPPPDPKVLNQLNQVVDDCFDVAERVLATHREFAKNFVAATAAAATSVASAVHNAAKDAASKQS
ncbi:MAG: hypothetical protein JO287_10940 [Pseudonocardiales bacterium]|nr:hypothetical protein [Pseudonocardiales bacterium]